MAIKAVIFDCYGVLVAQDDIFAVKAMFPDLSCELDELWRKSDAGQFTSEEFVQAISGLTGLNPDDLTKLFKTVVHNDPAVSWVRELKAEGKHKVALLSNVGFGWINGFLNDNKMEQVFDQIVLSCDVGVIKPSPEIFKIMADKLGVLPNECVMIDDKAANIAGAKSIGMKGIVFIDVRQARAELDQIMKA